VKSPRIEELNREIERIDKGLDIPIVYGGEEHRCIHPQSMRMPHDFSVPVGIFHKYALQR
jgi:hypothetical protein